MTTFKIEHEAVTLVGPGGMRLVLDPNEVFPNDPGNGTPAMVYSSNPDNAMVYSATLGCAEGTGELTDPADRVRMLTQAQLNWLDSQKVRDAIDAVLTPVGY